MKTIWMNVISGWNFIKIIRVVAGVFILISGIGGNNVTFILLGSVFLLFSLITAGTCCTMHIPAPGQKTSAGITDTEYEELGTK